jgi:hypothetical protein
MGTWPTRWRRVAAAALGLGAFLLLIAANSVANWSHTKLVYPNRIVAVRWSPWTKCLPEINTNIILKGGCFAGELWTPAAFPRP